MRKALLTDRGSGNQSLVGSSGVLEWQPARAERTDVTTVSERDVFPLVYRQMCAFAGRSRDLDDLVQTAAEQVVRALPTFEGRARLSTWTYRICYLTFLKHRRWHGRWLRRFTWLDDAEVDELAAPSRSDEEIERARRLRAAVDRLSPKRRAVVVLHDLEEVSVDEIATIVGANVLTVRSRLRDGRRDLARILSSDEYFGEAAAQRGADS